MTNSKHAEENKMNKKLMSLLALLGVVISTGCTNVREIAKINGVTVHKITSRSAFAPNVVAFVTSSTNQPGVISFPVVANGPALGPSVVGAAGNVGAAAVFGGAIRPSKTEVNNEATGGGGYSDSQGGSSYATGGQGYGGTGGAGGAGYSSSQSSSYSQSDSWSGVIGSANNKNKNIKK
jgi:hypothetical protein